MPGDDQAVLISALEHWIYCPRQCGLIHLERVWDENIFTMRGNHLHARADTPMTRVERGKRIERALPLWSDRLEITGRADVVEFLEDGTVVPVETKSGKNSRHVAERVQLCAQALCLEEMFGTLVEKGAIFYAASQKRVEVLLDDELRNKTVETIEEIRRMLQGSDLPAAIYDRRCRDCSLIDACLPEGLINASSLKQQTLFKPFKEAVLP